MRDYANYHARGIFGRVNFWQRIHYDGVLLGLLIALMGFGLLILYSAASGDPDIVIRQSLRFLIALSIMFLFAQIEPSKYYFWAPYLFLATIVLLLAVLIMGYVGKGAQRWLDLGIIRFQPSEIMKLALPMTLAWYVSQQAIPLKHRCLITCLAIIGLPSLLIIKQPDLGTALLIAGSGLGVLLFAGLGWRIILTMVCLGSMAVPLLWHFMHDYQRQRVLTFLDPERDPLGSGYHIIQSKIALGSGGFFGKGWLSGSQVQLEFLPEHATDFIFAVCGEEFGLAGCLVLLTIYALILARCLWISAHAQNTFGRLLAGGISLMFFVSIFINIGMVTGLLPVVGLPLPLVSYGGSSIVTMLAGFGVLMAIHSHRRLF